MFRRTFLAGLAATPARAADETVYWNAWGGDPRTNDFIAWTNERMQALHGITVRHVKLTDTAEAVARVLAEKSAGRLEGGSVDLIWINGANFLAMKQQGLLHGPVLNQLPNAKRLTEEVRSLAAADFTIPTEGYEIPWRLARIVFIHTKPNPPPSMAAMLDWSKANPGRLTHPTARNFLGATFLKQALVEFAPDKSALQRPATDAAMAPLWTWYRALRPNLWRGGKAFPETDAAQQTLMNDSELDLIISFDPSAAAIGVRDGTLPPTARAVGLAGGTIGNLSFVAIPFNAAHKQAALLLCDFLLSPEAQTHAADPASLALPPLINLPAQPPQPDLGPALPEPHPSWMTALTAAWEKLVNA